MRKAISILLFALISMASAAPTATNVRVKIEWIQVPTAALLEAIATSQSTGDKLRQQVQQLIEAEQATLQDISVTSISYQAVNQKKVKTHNDSIAQVIFPYEAIPDKFNAKQVEQAREQQEELNKERGYGNYSRAFLGGDQSFERLDLGTCSALGVHFHQGFLRMDIDITRVQYKRIDTLMVTKDKWGQTDWSQVVHTDQAIRKKLNLKPGSYQLIQYTPLILADDTSSSKESVAVFVKTLLTK